MSIDTTTLITILGMAVATAFTRFSGYLLLKRITLGPRMRAALDSTPVAVLVAIVAPVILTSGIPEAVAGAVTIATALRFPMSVSVVAGVGTVILLRHFPIF